MSSAPQHRRQLTASTTREKVGGMTNPNDLYSVSFIVEGKATHTYASREEIDHILDLLATERDQDELSQEYYAETRKSIAAIMAKPSTSLDNGMDPLEVYEMLNRSN